MTDMETKIIEINTEMEELFPNVKLYYKLKEQRDTLRAILLSEQS